MKIYMRDGDQFQIELPGGQILTIEYELPDSQPETLPQLELSFQQPVTVNLWDEDSRKIGDFEASQIVVPLVCE